MSWSCDRHYVDEYQQAYFEKMPKIGMVVSEKSNFNCHM